MMKHFKTQGLFLLGLLSSFQTPVVASRGCLTLEQTNDIVSRWTSLAIDIKVSVAYRTVTENFQFFSDNQDFLEGLPPGSLTGIPSIANRSDLIAQQQAAQAPGTYIIPQNFTIIRTGYSCNEITFHWRFHAIASGTDPASTNVYGDPIEYGGIDWLILNEEKLITTAYSEWNSGELLYDAGDLVCFQKGNASACPS